MENNNKSAIKITKRLLVNMLHNYCDLQSILLKYQQSVCFTRKWGRLWTVCLTCYEFVILKKINIQ